MFVLLNLYWTDKCRENMLKVVIYQLWCIAIIIHSFFFLYFLLQSSLSPFLFSQFYLFNIVPSLSCQACWKMVNPSISMPSTPVFYTKADIGTFTYEILFRLFLYFYIYFSYTFISVYYLNVIFWALDICCRLIANIRNPNSFKEEKLKKPVFFIIKEHNLYSLCNFRLR